ncbi:MAG: hypothetical protein R3C68_09815 [Myxococcota bacterium]
MERYRDSHERGERVGESFVLQAKLEKDINNNWRAAAALYRKAYEHDGRERGEVAAYWWVMCLRNVDPNEFAAAAQKYLRDFSRGEHAAEIREWLRR